MNSTNMKYSQEIKDLALRDFANEGFKTLCKMYSRLIESGNYNNIDILIKDFLTETSESTISKESKLLVVAKFKASQMSDLGISESYSVLEKEFSNFSDPLYKARLDKVKVLSEKHQDYLNVDSVIDIYKSLSADDSVVEQIKILETSRERFSDDIRILNFIEYLEKSELGGKFKSTVTEAINALKDYLADPTSFARAEALESLRAIGFDSQVKTMVTYLSALNFEDDDYGHNRDYGKASLATGRTYEGGYLEKWITGKEKSGFGKIVTDAVEEALDLKGQIPDRTIYKLLIERLSTVNKPNAIESKFIDGLLETYATIDMGLTDSVKRLRTSATVVKTPMFIKYSTFVNEKVSSGLPDRAFVHEAFDILSALDFDSAVVSELANITQVFETNKERLLVENVIDYINNSKNSLGLYENLKGDLEEYLVNGSAKFKNSISENHSNIIIDENIKTFLTTFVSIENKNSIVNSDPSEFDVKKVYSFFESVDGKDHFASNGNYYIRTADEINKVNESEISPTVKSLTEIAKSLNIKVINETTIIGNIQEKQIKIVSDYDTNETTLFFNGEELKEQSFESLMYVYKSRGILTDIKNMINLYENISLLSEMNFAQTIEWKRDTKVKATLFNIDGSFAVNFVNENINLNKFSKNFKYSTLKNSLLEFMDFDLSTSFVNELKIERNKVDNLKLDSNKILDEINLAESNLADITSHMSTITNKTLRKEGNSILESFQLEIDNLKKEYRSMTQVINESNAS